MKTWFPLLAVLAVVPPLHAEPANPPAARSDTVMSEGVVRRIDAANGKLTLRHGPIANLGMPAMTMVFRVHPVELLDTVKPGDKVAFHAEDRDGTYTVTAIRVVR